MNLLKIAFTFLLVFGTAQLATAQSFRTAKEVQKEQFTLNLKMGPANRVAQVSLKSKSGRSFKTTILNPKALASLKLPAGSTLKGTFRFNQLSGTDLGSGRFYEGWGTFMFDKVMKPDGQLIGCPPLCEDAVRLKVRLAE